MSITNNQFNPDYAVPPGWLLEITLEDNQFSQAEFARRCGRSPKLISEIISGKAPIDTETAIQFERTTGIVAEIWNQMESNYRSHLALKKEADIAENWQKSFPTNELVKRGFFTKPESKIDAVSKLLKFFAVGSIVGWNNRYGDLSVLYRHSKSFGSDRVALATWLRIGEIEADTQDCQDYDKSKFLEATKNIRGLTRQPIEKNLKKIIKTCNEAGVAFVLTPPLPSIALSGTARWLTPRKAIIQVSGRHKTDDHFWFSFFHEVAHILLHSKKTVFTDELGNNAEELDSLEVEANEWASKFLIPSKNWDELIKYSTYNQVVIKKFAREIEIAPGIVVGMLQHNKLIPWKRLNSLKQKIEIEKLIQFK